MNEYLSQIEITYANFDPIGDTDHDVAVLGLQLPLELLSKYQQLQQDTCELPDPVQFWKESHLAAILHESGKKPRHEYEPLDHILEFLQGKVYAEYSHLSFSHIRLRIEESLEEAL